MSLTWMLSHSYQSEIQRIGLCPLDVCFALHRLLAINNEIMSTTSTKSNFVIQGGNTESDGCTPTEDLVEKKNGNQDDRAAMWRMGKTQELRRDFSGIAIFGFTMILVASWETTLMCVLITPRGQKEVNVWIY